MKKSGLILLLLAFMTSVQCQDDLWFTRTGDIYFISHTDIIDIDANNHQVGSFFNPKTGEIAVTLLMKSFQFTLPLAEEHFNENYVESDKYPKATFKGKALNFDASKILKDTDYKFEVQGDLTIHGVTAPVKVQTLIRRTADAVVKGETKFSVLLDTYQIKVPNLVADRVAKEIPVVVKFTYEPYKKAEAEKK